MQRLETLSRGAFKKRCTDSREQAFFLPFLDSMLNIRFREEALVVSSFGVTMTPSRLFREPRLSHRILLVDTRRNP